MTAVEELFFPEGLLDSHNESGGAGGGRFLSTILLSVKTV